MHLFVSIRHGRNMFMKWLWPANMVLCFSLDERLHISWLTWWQTLTWKTRILHVDASTIRTREKGFPGDPGVKSPPAKAGDASLVPGPGRSCLHRSTEAPVLQLSPLILDLLLSTGEAAPVRSPCTAPGNNPAPRSWRKTPPQQGRPSAAKNKPTKRRSWWSPWRLPCGLPDALHLKWNLDWGGLEQGGGLHRVQNKVKARGVLLVLKCFCKQRRARVGWKRECFPLPASACFHGGRVSSLPGGGLPTPRPGAAWRNASFCRREICFAGSPLLLWPPFVLITHVRRTACDTRNRFLLQSLFLELIIQTALLQTSILFLEMAFLLAACSPVVLYGAADLL